MPDIACHCPACRLSRALDMLQNVCRLLQPRISMQLEQIQRLTGKIKQVRSTRESLSFEQVLDQLLTPGNPLSIAQGDSRAFDSVPEDQATQDLIEAIGERPAEEPSPQTDATGAGLNVDELIRALHETPPAPEPAGQADAAATVMPTGPPMGGAGQFGPLLSMLGMGGQGGNPLLGMLASNIAGQGGSNPMMSLLPMLLSGRFSGNPLAALGGFA